MQTQIPAPALRGQVVHVPSSDGRATSGVRPLPLDAAPLPAAADVHLLARLLGGGKRGESLAFAVLCACGGPEGLVFASMSQLLAAGLDANEADSLRAAMNLALRVATAGPPPTRLDRSTFIALMRPVLLPLAQEELHVVFVGADGRYHGRQRLALGGCGLVSLYPREVLAAVLEARAPLFALAHNHPQGRCEPSPEDVGFTARVLEGAAATGLKLLDHLVFAADGVASAMPAGPAWPGPGPVRCI